MVATAGLSGLAGTVRGGTPIGVELDGFAYWSTLSPFTDATSVFGSWEDLSGGTFDSANLTLDNYPKLGYSAKAKSELNTYPAWRDPAAPLVNYQVTWENGAAGGASVSFNAGTLQVLSSQPTAGGGTQYTARWSMRYDAGSGGGIFDLRVDNTLAGTTAAVSNLRVVPEQYISQATNTAPIYREEFLRKISPFTTLRMMDWQQTNAGGMVNLSPTPSPFTDTRHLDWADRVKPTAFSRTGIQGVPWEEMIALANASKKALWINIPDRASDDYVQNLSKAMRYGTNGVTPFNSDAEYQAYTGTKYAGLDPTIPVYVEYSNELWNTGPGSQRWQRVLEDGRADPAINDGVDAANDNRVIARQMAKQLTNFSAMLKQTLGESRVRPVLAGQTPTPQFLQYALDYLARRKYGAPAPGNSYQTGDLSSEIYSLAIAPYVGNDLGSSEPVQRDANGVVTGSLDASNATERDMYLNWLFDNLTKFVAGENGQPGTLVTGIRGHATLTSAYNLKLDSYEAGQHLIASNPLIKDLDGTPRPGDYNGDLKILANKDPRMAQLYQLLLNTWNTETSNGLFAQFALASKYTTFGSWGMLEDLNQSSTVKWDWYLASIAGDANLDGTVDFIDFSALEANFNAQHTMWGQGDFNLDGRVDYLDFLIFRDRFVPASPQEAAAFSAFAMSVPEPASMGALVLGTLILAGGRRRRS